MIEQIWIAWVYSLLLAVSAPAHRKPPPGLEIEIARAAWDSPLPGEQGRERMAATLVAIAWKESALRRNAIGKKGERGFFQVMPPRDPSAKTAADIVRKSYAHSPKAYPLACYASGQPTRGHAESLHRTDLAARLLREHPAPQLSALPPSV